MDEKELEALKTSNPKHYEFIMSLKKDAEEGKTLKTKAEQDAKAKADKEKADKETDGDLGEKARKEKQALLDKTNDTKRVESNLRFNMNVATFAKDNADLLPAEITDILRLAEKENYDTALDKANAVRVAIINSFFAVQDNVSALTATQKSKLDEFQKLTKNGKEEKAESIYENLFEPALETMKKVKKAEELGKARSGFAGSDKAGDAYKQRLMNASKKTYLGERGQ